MPQAPLALISLEVHWARLVDKVRLNATDIERYDEIATDDADTIVVAFGCTARSARHAVVAAGDEGLKAGLLRLVTVWPFPETRIRELIEQGNVKRFVVPEVNLGQLRREIERLQRRLEKLDRRDRDGEQFA